MSYCEQIHVGDIGVALIATFYNTDGSVRNISGYNFLQFILTQPPTPQGYTAPIQKYFTASFVTDGTDGLAQYITQSANDLQLPGVWQLQGFGGVTDGVSFHTNKINIVVYPNLV